MAVSARARALAVAILVLRVINLGFLAASLAIIASSARTLYDLAHVDIIGDYSRFYYIVGIVPREVFDTNFQDLYTYRFVLSAAAIGCAYTLVLIPLSIIAVVQGNRFGGTSAARILIFTDVVFCALFTSGGAAGLGLVVDNQRLNGKHFDHGLRKFYTSFDASCSLLLASAICTVVIVMVSVFSK
ncbi:hypothetical protein PVAP13_8KG272100 [Panicum virgatum]|uniref:CASP-like protein n=1 Tax=Panicum virgatum TaxID=38727 RepID=A0A8T0PLT7_PANVG|nr:hypothetical protein PVAP13_8KG272100 [Panicum virgatum]